MSIPERLFRLAPAKLTNNRPDRFDGSGFGVDLTAFGPADRARLARLYSGVNAVALFPRGSDSVAIRDRLLAVDGPALMRDASDLGSDTPIAVTSQPRVRRLLHDVRGGGLQVLLGAAELLRLDPSATAFAINGVSAARDHVKIMRAGFPALDPETYAADEAARVHVIGGFVATWDGLSVQQNGRTVSVSVACEYHGGITGRCLETASIDRILYNYVNNAVRFATDGRVTLWIFLAGPGLVRWAVHNVLSADDRAWLDRVTGGDPRQLFRGGTTRGGNGVGLSGCAEIVAECFGLDPEDALRLGHLGARADATGYYAWFHWPVYAPSSGRREEITAECECHV